MEGPPTSNASERRMDHSRSHSPPLPHKYRTVLSVHPTPLDSSQWNTALSELRHSIHQVRQDLGMSTQQHNESAYLVDDELQSSYSRDDERSTLSRTHLQNTLSLVQS